MRNDALRLAVRGYRIMAYLTGTMLVILCFICVPLRYLGHHPGPAEVVGAAHGVLYIIYGGTSVYQIYSWYTAHFGSKTDKNDKSGK